MELYLAGGSMVTHLTKGTDSLHFYYDAANRPSFVEYNGAVYAYVPNLQGDITGILDSTGTLVVTYTYDAWGKLIQTDGALANTLGKLNPFRYRGYVFDEETGLYYISSRYYAPDICRWINADVPETIIVDVENFTQFNLFTYCFNNPVKLSDEIGTWPSWATKLAIGVGAIVVGAAIVAATTATGGAALAFVGVAIAGLKTAAISGAIGAAGHAGYWSIR